MSSDMTSNKPYIIRAFYQWISDNQLTPYIAVDVNVYGVIVPMAYVTDGQIVLNVSMSAVVLFLLLIMPLSLALVLAVSLSILLYRTVR